jgi:PEP-CTERM motif-containing protein
MRKLALLAATAFAMAIPSAASAVVFANVGDTANLTFGGTIAGTSASLVLTLTGENDATGQFTFSYLLTNTSNTATNPTGRISSFGFNDEDRNITNPGNVTGTATGTFDTVNFNANYPNGLGNREICLFDGPAGTCTGNGNGVTVGSPGSGSFTLDYTATNLTELEFDDFAVRYQSLGANGEGSGTGTGRLVPPVPEPATWAMMLVGFGTAGAAMRRSRRKGLVTQTA